MVEKVARSISCLALMEEIMNIIYEKWDEILETVKTEHELSDVSFKTWLKPLTIHSIDDQVVTILVPSQQVGLNYISKKYALPLKVAISELTGSDYDIKFVLPEDVQNVEKDVPVSTNYNTSMEMANLNPKYTFDTFVVGSNNKFAHAASLAVAESPGEIYNPLFLYGGVGLGKTHLMQAIGNRIYEKYGTSKKICYIQAESFLNEFTNSLLTKTADKFKNKYRKLDVLLIDDIQFLQGKEGIQQELFYVFEALHKNKAQMVFTCDRPLKEIEKMEERLVSRLGSGMSLDLQPPNFETRKAIIYKKLENEGKTLSDDVVDVISKSVETNIRDLEAALNKIINYSDIFETEITAEIAQQQLQDLYSSPAVGNISIKNIMEVVAKNYQISIADLKSKKRDKKFVHPRHIALYIAKELTEYTFSDLGNEFGGRDHSSIMHACDKVKEQIKTDPIFNQKINILIKEIKEYKK